MTNAWGKTAQRAWVKKITDNRSTQQGILIELCDGYFFLDEKGMNAPSPARAFAHLWDAEEGTREDKIIVWTVDHIGGPSCTEPALEVVDLLPPIVIDGIEVVPGDRLVGGYMEDPITVWQYTVIDGETGPLERAIEASKDIELRAEDILVTLNGEPVPVEAIGIQHSDDGKKWVTVHTPETAAVGDLVDIEIKGNFSHTPMCEMTSFINLDDPVGPLFTEEELAADPLRQSPNLRIPGEYIELEDTQPAPQESFVMPCRREITGIQPIPGEMERVIDRLVADGCEVRVTVHKPVESITVHETITDAPELIPPLTSGETEIPILPDQVEVPISVDPRVLEREEYFARVRENIVNMPVLQIPPNGADALAYTIEALKAPVGEMAATTNQRILNELNNSIAGVMEKMPDPAQFIEITQIIHRDGSVTTTQPVQRKSNVTIKCLVFRGTLPNQPELLASFCTEFQAKLFDKYPDAESIEVLPSNKTGGIISRGAGAPTVEIIAEMAEEIWEFGDWNKHLREM